MANLDKDVLDDFAEVWKCYLAFERFSRREGEGLSTFLSQWNEKMALAQSVGCQYSDVLLACKLLEKANLGKLDVQSILRSIRHAKSEVLTIIQTRLETFTSEMFESEVDDELDIDLNDEHDNQTSKIKEESEDRFLSSAYPKVSPNKKLQNNSQNGQFDQSNVWKCPNCDTLHQTFTYNDKDGNKNQRLKCGDCDYERCLADNNIGGDVYQSDVEIKEEPSDMPNSFIDITINDLIEEENSLKNVEDFSKKSEENATEQKKHACTVCGKMFDRPWRATAHMAKIHGVKVSQSEVQNEGDNKLKTEKREISKCLQEPKGPCQCEFCGKKFPRKARLKKHYESFHKSAADEDCVKEDGVRKKTRRKKKGPFQCEFCGKKFTWNFRLREHYENCPNPNHEQSESQGYRCPSRRKTTCNICGKTFARPHNYKIHLSLHTGEKNFKCDICPAAFTHSLYLFYHKKRHEGVRPHKCDICSRTFLTTTNLKVHIRREHTHERPYQCNQCSYKSVSKYHLDQHMLTHTGERPYKCSLCDKTYRSTKSRNRHIKAHHGQNEASGAGSRPLQPIPGAYPKIKPESQN